MSLLRILRVNELYNKFVASYEKLGGLIIRTTISEYAKNEPEMARPLFKTMGTLAKSKAYGLRSYVLIFFKKDTIVIRERGLSDGLKSFIS